MTAWLTPNLLKVECEQAIADGFGDMPIEVFPAGDDPEPVVDFSSPTQRIVYMSWHTHGAPEEPDFIHLLFSPVEEDES